MQLRSRTICSEGIQLRSRVIPKSEKDKKFEEKGTTHYDEFENIKNFKNIKNDYQWLIFEMLLPRAKEYVALHKILSSETERKSKIIDKMRLITEIYYLLNEYSSTIFEYMNKVNYGRAQKMIMKFLGRISGLYARAEKKIESYKKVSDPDIMYMTDQMYHEMAETLLIYEPIYSN
jgi:hypothetical protein